MNDADPMRMRLLAARGGRAGSGSADAPALSRLLVQGRLQGAAGLSDRGRRRDRGADFLASERGLSAGRLHRRGDRGTRRLARAGRPGSSIRSTARRISPAASRTSASRSPASRRQGRGRRDLRPDARRALLGPPRRRGAPQRRRDQAVRGDRARQFDGRGRLEHARGRRKICRSLRRVALWGAAPFRSGSGALGIAYVAAGRRDGYVEHHINAWDCLAAILLVHEAGGYVSDFLSGEGLTKGNPLIACAPGVKDALISAAAIEGIAL